MIGYIRQGWLILLLAILFGGSLAGVESALKDRIAENKLNETFEQLPKLVPGADSDVSKAEYKRKQQAGETGIALAGGVVYEALDAEKKLVGYVISGSGMGFADKIELLIGLDAGAKTITGMFVLDQKETPGLGNKIVGEWKDQFAGKPAGVSLEVVKTKASATTEVDAISGATISSQATTKIVNGTVARFQQALQQELENRLKNPTESSE